MALATPEQDSKSRFFTRWTVGNSVPSGVEIGTKKTAREVGSSADSAVWWRDCWSEWLRRETRDRAPIKGQSALAASAGKQNPQVPVGEGPPAPIRHSARGERVGQRANGDSCLENRVKVGRVATHPPLQGNEAGVSTNGGGKRVEIGGGSVAHPTLVTQA